MNCKNYINFIEAKRLINKGEKAILEGNRTKKGDNKNVLPSLYRNRIFKTFLAYVKRRRKEGKSN